MNPDQYCVFGNPIAHSKSPLIHAAFALQTGEPIVYERRLAPLDGFALAARTFAAEGGKGANVTVPFKLDACALATVLTPRAQAAGAVNTLRFEGETILGDNTDGAGLVADIVRNAGVAIAGKRILLLGAGGAARGVVLPLLEQGPQEVFIANRSVATAEARWRSLRMRRVTLPSCAQAASRRRTASSISSSMPPRPAWRATCRPCRPVFLAVARWRWT